MACSNLSEDQQSDFDRLKLTGAIKMGRILGRGGYGTVYEVKTEDGTLFAAKEIHAVLAQRNPIIKQKFLNECIRSSRQLHPNIIQITGIYYPSPTAELPLLVMELMYTSLTDFIYDNNAKDIPLQFQLSILMDTCQGLLFLHSNGIMHRDLSSSNILLTKQLVAKIGDLGVARSLTQDSQKLSRAPGVDAFMSPEALTENPKYGMPLDVFSVGCVCIHLISMTWPQPEDDTTIPEVQRREKYLEKLRELPKLYALVEQCLKNSPNDRPVIGKVIEALQDIQQDLSPSEYTIFQLYTSLTECKKQCNDKEQELARCMQDKNQVLTEKTQQLEVKDREIITLKQAVDQTKQESTRCMEEKEQKLTEKNQQMEVKDKEIITLRQEVEKTKQESAQRIEEKNQELIKKSEQLEEKGTQERIILAQQFKQAKNALAEEIQEKNKAVQELKNQLEEMQASIARLSEELRGANHKIIVQNESLQAANNCMMAKKSRVTNASVSEFQNIIDGMIIDNNEHLQIENALREQCALLRKDYIQKEKECVELIKQVEDLQVELQSNEIMCPTCTQLFYKQGKQPQHNIEIPAEDLQMEVKSKENCESLPEVHPTCAQPLKERKQQLLHKIIKNKQMEIEVIQQTNEEERIKLHDKIQALQKELADAKQNACVEASQLNEQLRTKDEALIKLNEDLMVKQKSLADMHATNTRLSSNLEECQRVCQEQSENISIMQQKFTEKEEELGKAKSEHQKQSTKLNNTIDSLTEQSTKLHNTIDSLKEQLSHREKDLYYIRQELTDAHKLAKDLQLDKSNLEIKVSRSQQDQTNLEKELGLASDHVILLKAKHQKAVDRATELEEKLRCEMLSHEELKEQCVLLYIQKECDDQGIEVDLVMQKVEDRDSMKFCTADQNLTARSKEQPFKADSPYNVHSTPKTLKSSNKQRKQLEHYDTQDGVATHPYSQYSVPSIKEHVQTEKSQSTIRSPNKAGDALSLERQHLAAYTPYSKVADNFPEFRPIPKSRQKPKRHTHTDFDTTSLPGNVDDRQQSFHSAKEFWSHRDKCDKQPK